MSKRQVTLKVDVPLNPRRCYSFLGLGYRHNEPVPDRRTGWPAAWGVPLPKGAVANVGQLALRDGTGKRVPLQVRPLTCWDDGSVMFAHLRWQCDVANDKPASFTLELDAQGEPPAPKTPVVVQEREDAVEVDNGPLHAVIGRESDLPTLSLTRRGRPVLDGVVELWARDADGRLHIGRLEGTEAIRVAETGPLVGIVELRGRHRGDDGRVFLDYRLCLWFDAGRDELRLTHTFLNLGDEPDGVPVGEIGLRLPKIASAQPPTHLVCQQMSGIDSFPRIAEFPENVDVTIGATGPRIADVASLHEDTTGYPSYLMFNRELVDEWIGVRTSEWAAVTFFLEGKENWPKRMRVTDGVIEYHLWPAGADLHNLRQGMARTHHMQLAFFESEAPGVVLHEYCYKLATPANVTLSFEWYQECEVFGMQYTMPWMPRRYPLLEGTLLESIERGWATGMLGYGDDPRSGYDYTSVGMPAETVWLNNEHDFTSQAVIQTWRTGRPAAWKSARLSAEHQIDVDFVRKSDDRWKQGGIPAHCHFHTTAAVYPSHTFTEGLVHYYVTSGDDRALEVAQSLGRNLCMYVEERLEVLEVESRMMGWTLIALAALIEVTHDERCLRAAHRIRSSIQDVVDRTGSYDREGLNYGAGTVLTGLGNMHRVTGDESFLELMLTILDWHLEHGRNAAGIVWADGFSPYSLNLTLPGYAYAYHATGDRRYLEAGLEFFRFTGPPGRTGDVRSASKQYRTYIPFLKVAHEAGALDEMEGRIA